MSTARFHVAAAVAVLFVAGAVQAGITIDTVLVGDPGNVGELSGQGAGGHGLDRICGAVPYTYTIGKYEVTAGQYTAFLNAVANPDTYGLWNTDMSRTDWCSGITRSGTTGSYTYSVATDFANRPVNCVSWGDAARFANWLHNGQPTGTQTAGTTERGAYTLDGAMSDAQLLAVSREADWKWAITSEDEWYKAAYYKSGSTNAGYWDYPTGTNSVPGRDMTEATNPGNNANYYTDFGAYPIDSGKYTTVAGEFQLSHSPYGTFDQAGNVWEWNETIWDGHSRGDRGGSFNDGSAAGGSLPASDRSFAPSTCEQNILGFRVVAIPSAVFLPGDANGDGQVNVQDLAILAYNYNWYGRWEMGDFTGDGRVTVQDLAILAFNYGRSTPPPAVDVPEPATLSLLALGGSWVLRRRRK